MKILSIFESINSFGMISTNSKSFSIIREIVRKHLPSSKILLFGSRARSDNYNDSDYDFLIITKETIDIRKKRSLKSTLRRELAGYKVAADILIQSEEEIIIKKEIPGHIIKQVVREGILL